MPKRKKNSSSGGKDFKKLLESLSKYILSTLRMTFLPINLHLTIKYSGAEMLNKITVDVSFFLLLLGVRFSYKLLKNRCPDVFLLGSIYISKDFSI